LMICESTHCDPYALIQGSKDGASCLWEPVM
jgi:hypothetical protein